MRLLLLALACVAACGPGAEDTAGTPADRDTAESDTADADTADSDTAHVETGDTDTADTADTDTADTDTADTSDTADTDTADTSDTDTDTDTADTSDTDTDTADTSDTDTGASSIDTGDTADTDTGDSADTAAFLDADGDGSPAGLDCDDANAAVHPGASEACDDADVDEDCDGAADDADTRARGQVLRYADLDGDGFGWVAAAVAVCDELAGYVDDATDCDDTDATISPGAAEVCDDTVDQDCSGADEVCPLGGDYAVDDDYTVKIHGTTAGDDFGEAYTFGDFDGDGETDLLVGASDETYPGSSYAGVVYGFAGPIAGGEQAAGDVASFLYYNTSSSYQTHYGSGVRNLGDLDADGADDLAVLGNEGAFVYYGGDTGVASYTTPLDGSFTCDTAAKGGDTDGDGLPEWLCGYEGTGSLPVGSVTVYESTSSRTHRIYSDTAADWAGGGVAGGGDVDGDGYDDFWVSAMGDRTAGSSAGAVHLVRGPVSITSFADADATLLGDTALDQLGSSLLVPGDVDGDGHDDVLVGEHGDDTAGSLAGVLYLFTSVVSGDAASQAAATIRGEDAGNLVGIRKPGVGDVDGDGTPDLLVGSTYDDAAGTDAGAAWLVYGALTGTIDLATDADATWRGANAGDRLAAGVVLPDVDGDGRDELVLGASAGDGGGLADNGAIWTWYGR